MSNRPSISQSDQTNTPKRDRESISEDTEDEQRRLLASQLCQLDMSDMLVRPDRRIASLEDVKKRQEEPQSPLYRNRELLRIIYEEHATIVVEKVYGTKNFVVTYHDVEYCAENNYSTVGRVYVGTASECRNSHPGVLGM